MKWWASGLATVHLPLSPGESYQNITVNTGGAGELTFHMEDSPRGTRRIHLGKRVITPFTLLVIGSKV